MSFRIKNQLDGTVTKVHAEHLRLANVDKWDIPKDQKGRPIRKAKYAVPPSSSSSEDESDHSNEPLAKIAKKYQKQRDTSSDEDDIHLMELTKRMCAKEMALASSDETDGNISTSDDQKSLNEVKVVKRQTTVKQPRVKNLLQAIVGIL